ncbi:hypothetical protein J4464_00435 [Candidatus Woesearchaeota archaeon]|nr:hypothetical protein [Candidatus Woesearchaeota archaeon]
MKKTLCIGILFTVFLLIPFVAADTSVITNSLRPNITVIFNTAVDPDSIMAALDPKAAPGTNISIRLVSYDANKTRFLFTTLEDLAEGDYVFSINGRDLTGKLLFTTPKIQEFTVIYPPLVIELLNPRFGVSSYSPVDFTVGVNRQANCRYNLGSQNFTFAESGYDPEIIRTPYWFKKTGISVYANNAYPIVVSCEDLFYHKTTILTFYLTLDTAPPQVTYRAEPNPVTFLTSRGFESTLIAEADKDVSCRYSNNTNSIFSEMLPFPFNDVTKSGTYAETQSVTLGFPDQGTYTYAAECVSLANLSSRGTVAVDVRLPTEYTITILSPPSYTKESQPWLNFTINAPAAGACQYSKDSGFAAANRSSILPYDSLGVRYRTQLVSIGPGTHTLYVRCPFGSSNQIVTVSTTFSIDTARPEMISAMLTSPLANSSKTYYDDRLCGVFKAEDRDSGIDFFSYTVVDESRASSSSIVERGRVNPSRQDNITYIFDGCIDADLNNTNTYHVDVNATDRVGLGTLQTKSTNALTVDVTLAPENCDDLRKNGDETDVDCGGTCPEKCLEGEFCEDNSDCRTGYCEDDDGVKKCAKSSCRDDIKNGDETDVDCGGACGKCDDGDDCEENSDCKSGRCDPSQDICVDKLDTCTNQKLDEGEADVDCGGLCDAQCDDGSTCDVDSDCKSLVCDGTCKAASCTDNIKNGFEKGVDCGGTCDEKCPLGTSCTQDTDCASDTCLNGKCTKNPDSDNDGMDDSCEIANGFNPEDASDASGDVDDDGLTNSEECQLGTNPRKADTDGDGYNDGAESDAGTDPLDPDDHPQNLWWLWLLIVLVILLLAGGGYYAYEQYANRRPEPRMPPQRFMPPRTLPPLSRPPPRAEEPHKASVSTEKTEEWVSVGAEGRRKSENIFDELALLATKKKGERENIFHRLKIMSGEEIKPTHVKQIAESPAAKEDILKSFSIISQKNIDDKTSKEIKSQLTDLKESHEHLATKVDKVAEKLESKVETLIASKAGKKFHNAGCLAAKNIPKTQLITFKDRKEAVKKGYKPCRVCLTR